MGTAGSTRAPVSRSALRGLARSLGLDPAASDLAEARRYFASQDIAQHIDRVFKLANVSELVMTNDPFDPVEIPAWESARAREKSIDSVAAQLILEQYFGETAP